MNINTFGLSLSGLVLIAQALGFSAILWGAWRLISGLRGEGQSAEGVAHLRAELLGLLKPMLIGLLAVATLMGVALWERSPLTRAIQLIAPLSTLVWVLWSHYSAKKVNPGQLFEALVPLSISAPPELRARAEAWADQAHPLNARGLMQTTARAVQDLKMEGASFKSVGVEESLELTKESLIALHEMTTRFPLARLLTLSGEGQALAWAQQPSWRSIGLSATLELCLFGLSHTPLKAALPPSFTARRPPQLLSQASVELTRLLTYPLDAPPLSRAARWHTRALIRRFAR